MKRIFPNKPRILLCNDDGIYAPGLKALQAVAEHITDDIWTVAPETEQSGASHSLSLRSPISIREVSAQKFAVNGTPTDCILVALRHIMKGEMRPHLILSGVNHGSNLAEDIAYSGTVAAAMEATLLGVPAIAFSLDVHNAHPKWATAEHFGGLITKKLLGYSWPEKVFINVNFPNLITKSIGGIEVASQGQGKLSGDLLQTFDPRGRPYYWVGNPAMKSAPMEPHTDLAAINKGCISITPIYVDFTHRESLTELKKSMSDIHI